MSVQPDQLASELFFIVGTGRCGTTLLQAMLSSHPRIFIPPETWFFCSFDPARVATDPITDDKALDRYLGALFASHQWAELEIHADEFAADVRAGERTGRAIFLRIMRRWAERTGKPRAGEKTPHHIKNTGDVLRRFPQAKFIHIYRDPRDVALSMLQNKWRPMRVERYARTWAKAMDRHEGLARALGPGVYTGVRFETLLDQPESELRRLSAFLAEDFDPAMLAYDRREERGYSDREKGWKDMTLRPLDASRIGRYRQGLTARQIRSIERTVGERLEKYGYQRDAEVADRFAWRIGDALKRLEWSGRKLAHSAAKRIGRDSTHSAPDASHTE